MGIHNICINLRMQETAKISQFCKLTSNTKKDVIMTAVRWQLENLDDSCLSYMKSSRRTAYVKLDGEELAKLNQLAEIIGSTTAQAGLIAVRNFCGADEEGLIKYFGEAELAEVPDAFMIAVPANVVESMKKTKGPLSSKIRDALRVCAHADNLPDMVGRDTVAKRVNIRAYFPDEADKELLHNMMLKHNDGMSRVLARCLMLVHLFGYGQQLPEEEDFGIF